jgi:hypothetical protein
VDEKLKAFCENNPQFGFRAQGAMIVNASVSMFAARKYSRDPMRYYVIQHSERKKYQPRAEGASPEEAIFNLEAYLRSEIERHNKNLVDLEESLADLAESLNTAERELNSEKKP